MQNQTTQFRDPQLLFAGSPAVTFALAVSGYATMDLTSLLQEHGPNFMLKFKVSQYFSLAQSIDFAAIDGKMPAGLAHLHYLKHLLRVRSAWQSLDEPCSSSLAWWFGSLQGVLGCFGVRS